MERERESGLWLASLAEGIEVFSKSKRLWLPGRGLNWDLRKGAGIGDSIGQSGMRGQSQSCL